MIAGAQIVVYSVPADNTNKYVRIGCFLIFLIIFIVGIWGGTSQISGAVLARGNIALESSTKEVQHNEGGIVADILVKEGDLVKVGQILARIDSTVTEAVLSAVNREIKELSARQLRLIAEHDNLSDLPVEMSPLYVNDSEFNKIVDKERRLFSERKSINAQQKDILTQQIEGYGGQIQGLEAQYISVKKQKSLVQEELAGLRKLYKNQMVTLTQLSSFERQLVKLEGDGAQLKASVFEVKASIVKTKIQLLQFNTNTRSEVLTELKDTEIALARLMEKKTTQEDILRRVEILSPVDGRLQELKIHTPGGVIASGETLMRIIPARDELIIDAMVEPNSIDQVRIGQAARVRFVAFNASTTPILNAELDRISSDVVTDEKLNSQFYRARFRIDRTTLPKALRGKLVVGMPVEIHITTTQRTALSYFLKPLYDQFERTFKND